MKTKHGRFHRMVHFLVGFFIRKPCDHANAKHREWRLEDGTPMIESRCPNCGWYDYGHVYGD